MIRQDRVVNNPGRKTRLQEGIKNKEVTPLVKPRYSVRSGVTKPFEINSGNVKIVHSRKPEEFT